MPRATVFRPLAIRVVTPSVVLWSHSPSTRATVQCSAWQARDMSRPLAVASFGARASRPGIFFSHKYATLHSAIALALRSGPARSAAPLCPAPAVTFDETTPVARQGPLAPQAAPLIPAAVYTAPLPVQGQFEDVSIFLSAPAPIASPPKVTLVLTCCLSDIQNEPSRAPKRRPSSKGWTLHQHQHSI